LALRGQDFGELGVSLAAGTVLLGLMVVVYWKADNSDGSRRFTQRQLPWLAVLIFCGVVVDMLHIQIGIFGSPVLALILVVIEDGGEMVAASFLTAASVRQALVDQLHVPGELGAGHKRTSPKQTPIRQPPEFPTATESR